MVDDCFCKTSRSLRAHEHPAAIGFDQAFVVDQGIELAFVDIDGHEAIAGEAQAHAGSCGQGDCAELGGNHAIVFDGLA